jgi:hypothetical protein
MPFNPNIPLDDSLLIAGEMRSQFSGIVDLVNGLLPSVSAEVDDTTTLPAGDMAQAAAFFAGTTIHFTFAIPQGQDGQVGPEGPQGQTGGDGPPGPPFANAVVDGVATLPPGDPATVDVSFDGSNVHFSFGIPQGEQGAPGDVNTAQMDAAIADAVATTAQNPSGIGPYTGGFSDPPTQAEMQDFAAYVESLRVALVRGTQAARARKPAETRTRSTARKKRRPVARRARR